MGYENLEIPFTASRQGEEIRLGPLMMEEMAVDDAPGVQCYEVTLWGVGAAGIGLGTAYLIWSSNRENDLNERIARNEIFENLAEEEQIVDDLQLIGIIGLSVGTVATITGTVLALTRPGAEESADVSWSPGWIDGPTFCLEIRF